MSKKEKKALSEENLDQVSGGAVYTSQGDKLTGKDARAYMHRTYGIGGSKTTPKPEPVASAPVVAGEDPELSQGDMINNLFND